MYNKIEGKYKSKLILKEISTYYLFGIDNS